MDAVNNYVQALLSAVARSAESAASKKVDESVVVLAFILDSVLMVVQGINICVGAVSLLSFQSITEPLNALLLQVNETLGDLTSVTSSALNNLTSCGKGLSVTINKFSKSFCSSLSSVFGVVNTVTSTTGNLVGGSGKITNKLKLF